MGEAADRITDYTMTLVRQERMGEALQPERTAIEKWARPYRLYLKDIEGPDAGQEILFVRGWNDDRLRAHKGGILGLFTVSLDPYGAKATAHAHHPVTDVSLPGFVKTVLDNVNEARRRDEGSVRGVGRETLRGRPSLALELTSPRAGDLHVMKKGETLWDVARETGQTMYVILHANRDKGWRGPHDPRPGDSVFVPRYYAGKVLLWVDEELRLPIQALIYDFDGNLYERYEHRDLRVNVGLADADFDPRNPAYDF
jgi:LysM repeat protein